MVRRYFFLLVLFCGVAYANPLFQKIENIIGTHNYQMHKGLIAHIFKDQNAFTNGDKIRYFELFKTLQDNGLLDLRMSDSKEATLKFTILDNKQKGYKILNDTLETLGFKYFFTKVLQNNGENLLWEIYFKAEYNVDPVIFIKELKQNGTQILNIDKLSNGSWHYVLDFKDASLHRSNKIDLNEKVHFRKLLKPLLLQAQGINSIEIHSHVLNRWYPQIVFFDQNLQVLQSIEYDKYQQKVYLKAPRGARYVKVTDLYNLINIKRGLTIIVR